LDLGFAGFRNLLVDMLATLGLHLSRGACDKRYDKNGRWFHKILLGPAVM
jgi:hypothetical protein